MDLGGRVGKENKGHRNRKLAAVLPLEFSQVLPLARGDLESGVHCIDQQNRLQRRICLFTGFAGRAKGENCSGLFVVEKGEVLLLQAGHRPSRLVGYDYVEGNPSAPAGTRGSGVALRRRPPRSPVVRMLGSKNNNH